MYKKDRESSNQHDCMNRRSFLVGSTAVMTSFIPGLSASVNIQTKQFLKKKIINIKDLKADEPFYFNYPNDQDKNSFIVKLDELAAGGVGRDKDIVSFNQHCTHMGVSLEGTYKKDSKVMGACPMHLTTFDLTRHGMVVSGHATESLPQVMLEVSKGVIYAVGISGLLYGFNENPKGSE